MRTRIKHGETIETVTPGEMEAILARRLRSQDSKRIRATESVKLDANGAGKVDVYTVPPGFQFEARRVMVNIDSAADPSTGNVPLNVAGKAVKYLRSGTLIEYAVPSSPNAAPQVPGVQTWGAEQGPYIRNGEVFQIEAVGLTANAVLVVNVEGILSKPEDPK